MRTRWDETWHRLREWTAGQGPSERLAAQILLDTGFSALDPAHPLGGPDGGSDGQASIGGQVWRYGVYFPRGQQPFTTISKKFSSDLDGCKKLGGAGFAFVTNQELQLAERHKLTELSAPLPVEIFHLERLTATLDAPRMSSVRSQFLGIETEHEARSDHRDADRRRLGELLDLLPSDSDTIVFLRDYDLGGPFRWETLEPLRRFVLQDGEECKFLDPVIEHERRSLWELSNKFIHELAIESGPEGDEWSAVVPAKYRDWFELCEYKDYQSIVDRINALATEVFEQHQRMIQVARQSLGM